ncbi:MAG: glycosyltransferase family 2 protein [Anaerolineae bacterium]|nr:glycosyltransferase family 2 protein [Anaerolineae bacterium]
MMARLTHFSVIVPVYNGAETLDDCLTALVGQDYPQDQYEIVVVNDGSTDSTAQIASRYPVRLIDLDMNQGRIVARNTGARAAKYETLVFNDVRVVPERQLLAKVCRRDYQPLIPNVYDYDGSRWGFARFFYLLRCKVYAPHYPLQEGEGEFFITRANFDRVPKGTTVLVCDRHLWLASQPEVQDRSTSDDTRILSKLIEFRPILRTLGISAQYRQRTMLKQVIAHTFERGPRFADYYLRSGGRYYAPYLAAWLALGLMILGIVLMPAIGVWIATVSLVSSLGITALYLSQTTADFLVALLCVPVVVGAFGLGVLRWQAVQLVQWLLSKLGVPTQTS